VPRRWPYALNKASLRPQRQATQARRGYGHRINRTERALEAVSKAVREATWGFEREMLGVKVDDLPTPVISKLSAATDALAAVLVEAERFRGAR
jgi:hypothetical protein